MAEMLGRKGGRMLWANCNHKEMRWLRVGLALCLTVAFIPAPALASNAGEDGGTTEVSDSNADAVASVSVGGATYFYGDFLSALEFAQENSSDEVQATVTLLGDVNLGNTCAQISTGNMVLRSERNENGDDYTISGERSNDSTFFVSGGVLTLESGVISGLTYGVFVDGGSFEMNGGTVEATKEETDTSVSYGDTPVSYGLVVRSGQAVVSGGKVTGIYGVCVDSTDIATGSFEMNGGAVIGESLGVINQGGICVVNGGTISATDDDGQGISVWSSTELKGGVVTAPLMGVYVFNSTFVMSGGVVGTNEESASSFYGLYVYRGRAIISGGVVSGTETGAVVGGQNAGEAIEVFGGAIDGEVFGIDAMSGSVIANGGTITSRGIGLHIDNVDGANQADVILSGGTYSGDTYSIDCGGVELGDLLSDGVGYWQNGELYTPGSSENRIKGEVTVKSVTPVYGATLTLDGSIGVNFYVDMSGIDEGARSSYKMRFKVNDADVDSASYGSSATNTFGGATYHRFTCSVNSCQMNDTITAQLYCGDTPVSKAYTYSVKTYADHMIAAGNNEKLVSLVEAMLNYGSYAQTAFGYRTGALALGEDARSVTGVSLSETYEKAISGKSSSLPNVSASLVLDSETAIRFYFSLGDVNAYAFTVDGEAATLEAVESDSDSDDTHYCIEIANIAASQLDTAHTLTITSVADSTATMTLSYSALSYAYDVVSDENADESLQNLVKALYLYNQAANAYFETA